MKKMRKRNFFLPFFYLVASVLNLLFKNKGDELCVILKKEVTSLKVFDINRFDPVYCGITKWKNFKNWFGNVVTSFSFEFAVSNHRRDKLTATMVKKINLKYALHTLNVISMVSWFIHWIILKISYFSPAF